MINLRTGSSDRRAAGARRGLRLVALGALLVTGMVTACSGGGKTVQASSSGIRTVRIAQPFTSTLNSGLLDAIGQGYFKAHDIQVKFISVNNGAALQTTLGGSADMALASGVLPLTALNQGQQFKVFAQIGSGFPESVIISTDAYKSSGLTDASTFQQKMQFLAGKPFGVSSPSGSTVFEMRYLFKLAGLPESDFNMVTLGSGDGILAALKSNKVVAGSIGSPYPQVAESDGYAKILISVTGGEVPQLKNTLTSVLVVTPQFYAKNTALLNDFKAALAEGQKYVYDHPTESDEYVWSTYFKTSPKAAILEGLTAQRAGKSIAPTPDVDATGAQNLVTFMKATGQAVPDSWRTIFPDLS